VEIFDHFRSGLIWLRNPSPARWFAEAMRVGQAVARTLASTHAA
jgi:hypothetical protein